MKKECNCDKWKANMPVINGYFQLAYIHGAPYDGDFWEYCPWCSRHLTTDAPDHRGVFVDEQTMNRLYERVELKDGVGVQVVGVHPLSWRPEWGSPKFGFVEFDHPNGR